MNAFWRLTLTDLKLYLANRRALVMNLLAPIAIAAFFGYLFGGSHEPPARLPVAISDQDRSVLSRQIVAAFSADSNLAVQALDEAAALAQVRAGKLNAVVVIPSGFGAAAGAAMFRQDDKPRIAIHYDPSQSVALQMVRGLLAQSVMQNVGAALFNAADSTLPQLRADVASSTRMSAAARQDILEILDVTTRLNERQKRESAADGMSAGVGMSLPYALEEREVRASDDIPYNSYAHSFAGMSVQFVLMMGVELGVGLLALRRLGLWRRLRAAPLGKAQLLGSRVAMASLTAIILMAVIYAAAMAVFGVRIQGSVPGFIGVVLAFAVLTGSLGLLIAAIGRTPEATRGLAIFLTLILVMLGGAWVPSFVFPAWLQQLTAFVPTRWAVDGLDAMTWRGLGFDAAVWPIAAMLALSAVCLLVAVRAFEWEE